MEPVKNKKGLRAMSSIRGRIKKVLILAPYRAPEDLMPYKPLLAAFGREVQVVFMVAFNFKPGQKDNTEALIRQQAKGLFKQAGLSISHHTLILRTNLDIGFTKWAQDTMVVLTDAKGTGKAFFKPHLSPRNDFTIDQLSVSLNMGIRASPLVFEGGNLLNFLDAYRVGADLIIDNLAEIYTLQLDDCLNRVSRFPVGQEEIEKALHEATGQKVIDFVGGQRKKKGAPNGQVRKQPFFHLDLYLTPAIPNADTSRPRILVAKISRKTIIQVDNQTIPAKVLSIKQELNKLARKFKKRGYEVIRLPVVVWIPPQGQLIAFFSYNNAQVQYFPGENKAIIPAFRAPETVSHRTLLQKAFKKFNKKAGKRYKKAGFSKVVKVKGKLIYNSSIERGSVHCLTKVLEREYF